MKKFRAGRKGGGFVFRLGLVLTKGWGLRESRKK